MVLQLGLVHVESDVNKKHKHHMKKTIENFPIFLTF